MISFRGALLCAIFVPCSLFALPSIATVTSAEPFSLDGHKILSPGVTSYPLVSGDTIATTNGLAVLLFRDGSSIKLDQNSIVKLETVGFNPTVTLLLGGLDYRLVAGSNVKVMSLDTVRKRTSADAESNVPTDGSRRSAASSRTGPGFIISAGGRVVASDTSIARVPEVGHLHY
jgi:hypothetical protein